jgi:hypothetical protein
MPHLDDGLIQELLDGEVPSSDLAPIQAHLAECAACAVRLEAAREFAGEADQLLGLLDEEAERSPAAAVVPDIAPPRRVATWPRNLAWAASLVLAVGLGYTARGGMSPSVVSPATSSMSNAPQAEVTTPRPDAVAADRAVEPPATPARDQARAEEPAPRQLVPAAPLATQESRRDVDALAASGAGAREREAGRATGIAAPAPAANALAPARQEAALGEVARRSAMADEAVAAKAVAQVTATADSTGTPQGPLFLITGMEPVRFDIGETEVRVVYRHVDGEVHLVQRRVGSQVAWHLEVPAGFPADTLAALGGRVR